MSSSRLVCVGNNVLLPESDDPQPATITVDKSSGKISAVHAGRLERSSFPEDVDWIDAGDFVVLPGLVDTHVHLNEPGRTDWEGFWTGTRAAASGGITTVVDMPLNSIPPTTTVDNLEVKRSAAQGQCFVDVAFWGGVIPGNQAHLSPLVDAGVKGFKCFLIESGVEEFPCVSADDLHLSMDVLQHIDTVLLFHAELDRSEDATKASLAEPPNLYSTFLSSRPQSFETDAITLITELQSKYPQLKCHIVHLSAAEALPVLREARKRGLKLSAETCFHYLCLAADDIPHGHPEFKCCPPIREQTNRDLLWDALKEGIIDMVVSDHSPCIASLKKLEDGDIMSAWGGISTLGLGLSLLWTEGLKRGISLSRIVDWTAVKTAKHAGLDAVKGKLEAGFDGDFIIWNPEAEFEVTKASLNFKNKLSAYEGVKLKGRVEKTFLRGRQVYDSGNGFQKEPFGKLL